jgi:hypothetical protein
MLFWLSLLPLLSLLSLRLCVLSLRLCVKFFNAEIMTVSRDRDRAAIACRENCGAVRLPTLHNFPVWMTKP